MIERYRCFFFVFILFPFSGSVRLAYMQFASSTIEFTQVVAAWLGPRLTGTVVQLEASVAWLKGTVTQMPTVRQDWSAEKTIAETSTNNQTTMPIAAL